MWGDARGRTSGLRDLRDVDPRGPSSACAPATSQRDEQRSLALLSREMNCRKALSGHRANTWTPSSEGLEKESRRSHCSRQLFSRSLHRGRKPSSLFFLICSQSHALWLDIMPDCRHSGVYFMMPGFCMCLNATLRIFSEPASLCSAHSVCVCVCSCVGWCVT